MAYKITTKPNTHPVDATYPYGDIKDNTGSNDGTPVNRLVYADFHQFFAKMAAEAGVTLNDLPDNAVNGFQFFEALVQVIVDTVNPTSTGNVISREVEIGTWNMNSAATKQVPYPGNISGYTFMGAMVKIRDDSGLIQTYFNTYSDSQPTAAEVGGAASYDIINDFTLSRSTGGEYATNSNYSSTAANRGWVYFMYMKS